MQIYSPLLDIILYFVVAGLGMTFLALLMVAIASSLESTQNHLEQESHALERLRLAASSPNAGARHPICDQEEEIKIQKRLAEERERLRRLKENN